jgi:ribosomal protein uL13
MKIIDGEKTVLGRLASYSAKQALNGEDIVILNCEKVIITGNKKRIKFDFQIKRGRVGSSQKGPKHHRDSRKIVKRAIRGMLPDHRMGRGRIAFKKIRCHIGIPEEFKDKDTIKFEKKIKRKYWPIGEFAKNER